MSKRTAAIIIASFLTVFVAFAVRYSYGLLLPEMLLALVISKTQAGVIYSSYFIAYTVFSPILGLLADRYSARFLLTLFVGILGTGALLMSYSSSVINASLFFALAGIGHSACWVPVVALIQRWVSEKRKGTALALVESGSAVGIAIWSTVIPFIVASYNWRAGWVSLGVLAFLVAGINFLIVRTRPDEASGLRQAISAEPNSEPISAIYKRILDDANFWLMGLSYLFIGFSILVPFTFLSAYATQELMMPYGAATRLIAVIAISAVFGKLMLGPLSDAVGRIRVIMLCLVLTGVGNLGMACLRGFYELNLVTAVFGFGYGAIWPVYAASVSDYFSRTSTGSVIGLWTLCLGVGSMLSPVINGWVIDITGKYSWAFMLAVMSAVISLSLLLPIRKVSSGAHA